MLPDDIAGLINEDPSFRSTDLTKVRVAIRKSGSPELAGPRTHGSKVLLDGENVGLFDAIDGETAESHVRDDFTYLIFPIKKKYSVAINAAPSYLLPKATKVEVAISPKGNPQIVVGNEALGAMYPSGDLCVILGFQGKFITWFPVSESEEPWSMAALKAIEDHLSLAKVGIRYRISDLESYLGGSFDVVRKTKEFHQEA